MGDMMRRLLVAMNAHDLDAFVNCFAPDYHSEQPVHPSRAFAGSSKVRENWASVFSGVPDFEATLLSSATADDDVEIGEWHWHGTHSDGAAFAMRGVIVMGIVVEQIKWARLYMETVDSDDVDIDQMVRETYHPDDGG